jgi:hypothetical protein
MPLSLIVERQRHNPGFRHRGLSRCIHQLPMSELLPSVIQTSDVFTDPLRVVASWHHFRL